MPPPDTSPSLPRPLDAGCLRLACGLGLVVSLVGAGVLAGWLLGVPGLMIVAPGLVATKANTAVCLVLGGLSLFFFAFSGPGPGRRVSAALAAGMALVGALSLFEYLTGLRLGIDELLVKDTTLSVAPGRPAPLTSLNCVGLGAALLLLRFPRWMAAAQALAIGTASTAVLAIVGYCYAAAPLYEAGHFSAVALPTASAFLLLCAGVWCAGSQHGFMRVVTNSETSGLLVRLCTPAVLMPLLIGWARVQGVRLGWFSSEVGVVLVAMSNAAAFLALIWIGALSVQASEGRRAAAQQRLRQSEEKYRTLFTSIDAGFCVIEMLWDDRGCPVDYRFLEVNRAFEVQTGLRDAVGRTIRGMHPDFEQVWVDRYGQVARTGEAARFIEGSDVLGRWFDVYAFAPGGDARIGQVAILFSDISERRQAELALHAAKSEAEEASRAKDDFLAALSHELRTPLTPVLMAASDLCDDPALPDNLRETLRMMQRNIGLEARLIDDLLDLTRIAKGKLELRAQDCEAHSLLGLAVEIVRDDAQAKGIGLGLDLAAVRTHFVGDPSRVQQVFWNLLKNAVKFTPPGGQISIRSRDEEQQLVIEISDTGLGLAPENLERVFKPFEQAGLVNNAKFGGLGLGLAIAKAIVDMHGGTIRAESAGPGRGATFRVALQAAERPLGVAREGDPGAAPAPPGRGGSTRAAGSWRLLLVEDHDATIQVLTRLLTRAGYQVTTASSVAAGRAAAEQARFDLVISDVGLPDGTGVELMETLHARHGLRGIALTGYGMEDDQRRTRAVGFIEHLVKPVDFAQLQRAIERALLPEVSLAANGA